MKNTFIATALLLSVAQSTMLSAQLTITPNNQTGNAACPDIPITYTIEGIPNNCSPTIVVTPPDAANSFAQSGKTITVNWKDFRQNGTIKVQPPANSCFNLTEFTVPVLSLAGMKPEIKNCPTEVIIGKSETFVVGTDLDYDIGFLGQEDNFPEERECTSYE